MAIDETNLTKGQIRKLNALRKSVSNELGEAVFAKWCAQQTRAMAARTADSVAVKIEQALAGVTRHESMANVSVEAFRLPCKLDA